MALACLAAISSHLNEGNLNNFVSSLTRPVVSWKLTHVLGVEQVGAASLSNFVAAKLLSTEQSYTTAARAQIRMRLRFVAQ